MQCSATIVQIDESSMQVQVNAAEFCQACSQSGGCGTSLFRDLFNRQPAPMTLPRLRGGQIHDHIMLEISDRVALPLAFVGFLVPLLCLFGAAMLSQSFVNDGTVGAVIVTVAGILGFIGGLIAYRPLSGYVWSSVDTPITATGILNQG